MKSLLTDQIVADDVSVRALLGLGPRGEDVGDLRQLQLAPLRGKGKLRLWMGVGMGLVAAFNMALHMPWPLVCGWLACTLIFSLWSYRIFEQMPLDDPKVAGLAEYKLCCRHALYSALVWGTPFWIEGFPPSLEHVLSIWSIAPGLHGTRKPWASFSAMTAHARLLICWWAVCAGPCCG